MSLWIRVLRSWLPLGVAITLGALGLYGVVQQTYRTGANDPQIQLAEQGAAAFSGGVDASQVVSETVGTAPRIDISQSVSPFVIVYNESGTPVASSALLDGEIPVPPVGVLDASKREGGNRVTWQPKSGVRIASVTVAAGSRGFVLAGRSLREPEARIDALGQLVGFGWIATMLVTLALAIGLEWFAGRRRIFS